MRLLSLGGTVFVGRHLVEAALARGYDVTTFTRAPRRCLGLARDAELAVLDAWRARLS